MIHLFSHPSSGRTWLKIILDDLGIEFLNYHGKINPNILDWTVEQFVLTKSSKMVYLLRNPFDTLASHLQKKTKNQWVELDSPNFLTFDALSEYGAELIIKHHLQALYYAQVHSDFILLKYEKLRSSSGLQEIQKAFPNITKEVWEKFSYDQMVQKAKTDKRFDLKYKLLCANKMHGGLVGQGEKYLNKTQNYQMNKIIDKYDYWNKMKELDDLVS